MTGDPGKIVIDPRAGSGDLLPFLVAARVPCEHRMLAFGDAAFMGNGPDGCAVPIGVEVKTIGDVLNCIQDSRFAGHQLPGLLNSYQVVYLLIEGRYRVGENGELLIPKYKGVDDYGKWRTVSQGPRLFMFRDLENWLTTMDTQFGVKLKRSSDHASSAAAIASLFRWWTLKSWDMHQSGKVIYVPSPNHVLIRKPTQVHAMYAAINGVGYEKGGALSKAYPIVEDLIHATIDEIAEVRVGPRKTRLGVSVASKVYQVFRGGRNGVHRSNDHGS